MGESTWVDDEHVGMGERQDNNTFLSVMSEAGRSMEVEVVMGDK